jgi:hypothetical protein
MSTTKTKRKSNQGDEIFEQMEAELPDDYSDLMFEGRQLEGHGARRSYLDDDGR